MFVKSIMITVRYFSKGDLFMAQIFEVIMLVCFGLSWPISVYKSIKSKSTQGKSIVFILAIIIGYVAGIASKIISAQFTYVLALYCFNLLIVCIDFALYIFNRHREKVKNTSLAKATI